MKRQRLLVRADASFRSGAGHVMRAIALAQELAHRGAQVEFACLSLTAMARERLTREGFAVIDLSPEASLTRLVDERQADWLIIDLGPSFSSRILENVPVPVVVIDDLGQRFTTPPALVVNQNLHAVTTTYHGIENQAVLRGPSYMMFRDEFLTAGAIHPVVLREEVLLMLGGTDPLRLLPPFAEALTQRIGAPLNVVASFQHPDVDRLRRLACATTRMKLYHDLPDLARLMARSRLAVTSGGTTVWELAVLGVPSVVGSVAPIEDLLLSGLDDRRLFDVMGSFREIEPKQLAEAVAARLEDHDWLEEQSRLGMSLVDGQGRRRVVDAMEERS